MLLLELVSGHYYDIANWLTVTTEEQMEEDKKKVQSMAEVMKNPTKIVLLQV